MKKNIFKTFMFFITSICFALFISMGINFTKKSAAAAPPAQITLVVDQSNTNVITPDLDSTITLPTFNKTGYHISGWYLDENYQSEAIYEKVVNGTNNISFNYTVSNATTTLYAKWDINKYDVSVFARDVYNFYDITHNYGDLIKEPTMTERTGYNFLSWCYTSEYNISQIVDFENDIVTSNLRIYAIWEPKIIKLAFHTNTPDVTVSTISADYNEIISAPNIPTRANYVFLGWYMDNETFENAYDFSKATALPSDGTSTINLYAKWQAKQQAVFSEDIQTYNSDDENASFIIKSEYSGFYIEYLVNGTWQEDAPTSTGAYDVKITRLEDETFASVSKVLTKAFVIKAKVLDLTWLIAVLFIIAAAEIIFSIVLRHLQNMKRNSLYSFYTPLLLASVTLPSNQIVLLIISGALAIFGFILMVYNLVKLHRTLPSERFRAPDEVAREKMEIHINSGVNAHNSNSSKYTAADIEAMLQSDTFGEEKSKKYSSLSDDDADKTKDSLSDEFDNTDDLDEINGAYKTDVEYFEEDEDDVKNKTISNDSSENKFYEDEYQNLNNTENFSKNKDND